MSTDIEIFLWSIFLGVGATLLMDLWAWLLLRTLHIQSLNYAMLGRWIGHMPKGRLKHQGIHLSSAIAGEAFLGWTLHYLIGIVFAGVLLWGFGLQWLNAPHLMPALLIGCTTLVFPFLIMQPCFGMGIAARHTPKPMIARLKSLVAHLIFGLGLYLCAWLANLLLLTGNAL